ncbi:DUF3471 domain-containing protein [Pseudotenacibaculum haliotis]|uniref:DUF3471 domain-containing protein n=1 Tax=Pseudotenacibaculum haliotis TaxID=1862138 RepID=A0ABW5LU29_9FLAO
MKKQKLVLLLSLFFALTINVAQAQESTKKEKTEKKEFKVSKEVLKTYVGTYEVDANVSVSITLEDGFLYGEPTGQRKLKLIPTSEHRFTLKEIGADLLFNKNDKGKIDSFYLIRGVQETKATRIESK